MTKEDASTLSKDIDWPQESVDAECLPSSKQVRLNSKTHFAILPINQAPVQCVRPCKKLMLRWLCNHSRMVVQPQLGSYTN